MNRGLQNAGGVAALVVSLAFVFVFALAATVLAPMVVPELPFGQYQSLHQAYGTLIYIWHFIMYIAFGLFLVVVATALHERLKENSPASSKIAQALGLIYAAFVLLGGLLTIHGDEAVLALAASDPNGADTLRRTIAAITLCVDSSDRLLGCLWIGVASFAALRTRAYPRGLAILGLVIGSPGLIGMAFPSLLALSYVFGIGIIVWSGWLGVWLLRNRPARLMAFANQPH
jgi:hypothetical protein